MYFIDNICFSMFNIIYLFCPPRNLLKQGTVNTVYLYDYRITENQFLTIAPFTFRSRIAGFLFPSLGGLERY